MVKLDYFSCLGLSICFKMYREISSVLIYILEIFKMSSRCKMILNKFIFILHIFIQNEVIKCQYSRLCSQFIEQIDIKWFYYIPFLFPRFLNFTFNICFLKKIKQEYIFIHIILNYIVQSFMHSLTFSCTWMCKSTCYSQFIFWCALFTVIQNNSLHSDWRL